jgi:hypothetical protein
MTTPQKPWRARTRVAASAVALLIGSSAALVACGNEPDDNTVAKLLPQNTIGFVSAAISPSNKQKLSLFALSKHFPSQVQTDKAEDVRDKLLAELFEDTELNYEADVKPWLGSEAAAAVLPSYTDDHIPVTVAAVKQTDKEKAQAALDKTKQPASTYRFIDDYIFFIDEAQISEQNAGKALDDIEALSKDDENSLQKNKRFKKNIDKLHGEHLLIGWLDTPVAAREGIAAAKAATASSNTTISSDRATTSIKPIQSSDLDPYADLYGDSLTGGALGSSAAESLGGLESLLGEGATEDMYVEIQKAADEVGSFSFELYATSDSFVVEGVTEKIPADIGEGTEKPIFNGLPNDTLAAVTVSDFGKSMQTLLAEMNKEAGNDPDYQEFKPSIDKLVNSFGSEVVGFVHNGEPIVGGMVVELKDASAAQSAVDDLINKFKPSGLITVKNFDVPGGKGYDIQTQEGGGGFDFSIDPKTGELVQTPKAPASSGPHIFIGVANNRLGITNDGGQLTAALAGNGDFGNQAPVKKALVEQKVVFGAFFVNIDQAIVLAEKAGSEFTGEDGEWVKSLDVLGTQSWTKDDSYHMELRLGLK